ncbi:MAG TPA: glycosyltransferase [Acidimicrobiia bacterium]|nr:glycosyltransferase [Acidimicrobiia bacterium]
MRLTGELGLYEHAEHDRPRLDHGYTTDDNARALVVLAPVPAPARPVTYERALDFVVGGRVPFGWHNRMSVSGEWRDRRGPDDAHGRAVWGLGVALGHGEANDGAAMAYLAGLDLRSPHLRAMSFAVLGAVAARRSGAVAAESDAFLDRLAGRLGRPGGGSWPWPEPRLTYANARVPQALIEVGDAIGDTRLVDDGLELLAWLREIETHRGVFSFTPVGGRGPGEQAPAFDQQPIEAWAMADACVTAFRVDGGSDWRRGVATAARWFLGGNDNGTALYDPITGAGFDGLHGAGRNLNRGAESTLSALGAMAAWDAAVRPTVGVT